MGSANISLVPDASLNLRDKTLKENPRAGYWTQKRLRDKILKKSINP